VASIEELWQDSIVSSRTFPAAAAAAAAIVAQGRIVPTPVQANLTLDGLRMSYDFVSF